MPNPLKSSNQGLSRNRRIKASRLFEETFAQNQRASGRFLTVLLRHGPGAALRLGVVAGRGIGCAAKRNRAKRRLREAFRLNRHLFAGPVDVVIVARPAVLDASWPELQADLLHAARKLGALAAAKQASQEPKF